jgi:putative transposase
VWLPKFKEPIKIKLSRKIEGNIRKSIVSKNASGEYYISILIEDGKDVPEKVKIDKKDDILGIDVGIKDFCVTSDGEVIENQKFLRSKQKRLKLLQRKLSHKQKGSNNRNKAKLKVAKLHQTIVNKRTDFLHKLSFRLVSENKAIAREDLNVQGMMKNHNLANALSDVAWSQFDSMLTYKSEWYGKHFLEIGRFEPSSKMCNKCGHYHGSLVLSDRTWTCEKCGSINDRDFNASLNIRDFSFISFNRNKEVEGTQGHGEVKSVRLKGNKKPKSKDEVVSGQKEEPVTASNSNSLELERHSDGSWL